MNKLFFVLCLLISGITQAGETVFEELRTAGGETIHYAVHLPDGFEATRTYPVLVGPGEGVAGEDPGFYWQNDPHSLGWIIVDAQLWESDTKAGLVEILDSVQAEYNVEGGRFHAVCWSANSAGIFDLIIEHSGQFISITGMAGNPRNLSSKDIEALQEVKVQFVVGENDRYWLGTAQKAHEKLQAGGVNSIFEIVPDAPHVMVELIGKPFIGKLEKLRSP